MTPPAPSRRGLFAAATAPIGVWIPARRCSRGATSKGFLGPWGDRRPTRGMTASAWTRPLPRNRQTYSLACLAAVVPRSDRPFAEMVPG